MCTCRLSFFCMVSCCSSILLDMAAAVKRWIWAQAGPRNMQTTKAPITPKAYSMFLRIRTWSWVSPISSQQGFRDHMLKFEPLILEQFFRWSYWFKTTPSMAQFLCGAANGSFQQWQIKQSRCIRSLGLVTNACRIQGATQYPGKSPASLEVKNIWQNVQLDSIRLLLHSPTALLSLFEEPGSHQPAPSWRRGGTEWLSLGSFVLLAAGGTLWVNSIVSGEVGGALKV